ncbi:MAG: hypothetical protein ACR652_18640 [Methylocystis sp.]|uniref:hypothetical protein n=1 Tax=Methylocystis sp. TaxID=1911079 RepID=UPI003DA66CE6
MKLLDYIRYRRQGVRPGLAYRMAWERHGITLGDVILLIAIVAPYAFGSATHALATDRLERLGREVETVKARAYSMKLETAFIQCLNRGTVQIDRWTHTCEIKRIPL